MDISAILLSEITAGLPDSSEFIRVCFRLATATLLGGIIGVEREIRDKSAGLRTHMLVALGSALFVLVPLELGIGLADLTRTVQGVATGIGFIGAGAIIKHENIEEVQGLTTAAGIWLTAGVGVAVGMGSLGIALIGMVLCWTILAIVGKLQHEVKKEE